MPVFQKNERKKLFRIVVALLILSSVVGGPLVAYGQNQGGVVGNQAGQTPDATSSDWWCYGRAVFTSSETIAGCTAQMIGGAAVAIPSLIVTFAGIAADVGAAYSLLQTNDGESIYSSQMLREGWTVFRDLVNVIFIFIIIYIGLSTILGVSSVGIKQLLTRVIIVALLINFSLALAGIVVDAGNIMALSFYNAFPPRDGTLQAIFGFNGGRSLSYPFVQGSNMGFIFKNTTWTDLLSFGGLMEAGAHGFKMILYIVGAWALLLIVAFVLFAVGLLFLIRTAVLWFLLIISPLAFAAFVLPGTRGYANKWLNTFLSNVFWAPAFMALYYVAARIYTSPAFKNTLRDDSVEVGIISFIMVTILVLASLIVSKQLGAYASSTVTKWSTGWMNKTGGFAGRHTIGRGANAIRETGWFQEQKRRNTLVGRIGGLPLNFAADKARYRGTKSFGEMREARRQEIEQNVRKNRSDPRALYTLISNLRGEEQRHAYEKLSARDRAAVEREMEKAGQHALRDRLRAQLSPEEAEKTRKALKEVGQEERWDEQKEDLANIAAGGNNPATGAPYTDAEVKSLVSSIKPKNARKLPHEARMNPRVIRELSPRHLADLMAEGDLQPDEITAILNEVTGPAQYPKQNDQLSYINRPDIKDLWTP